MSGKSSLRKLFVAISTFRATSDSVASCVHVYYIGAVKLAHG